MRNSLVESEQKKLKRAVYRAGMRVAKQLTQKYIVPRSDHITQTEGVLGTAELEQRLDRAEELNEKLRDELGKAKDNITATTMEKRKLIDMI